MELAVLVTAVVMDAALLASPATLRVPLQLAVLQVKLVMVKLPDARTPLSFLAMLKTFVAPKEKHALSTLQEMLNVVEPPPLPTLASRLIPQLERAQQLE